MVRKNISVGVDTWNALAALGKFGDTFDDIIKILLEEHNELKQLAKDFGGKPIIDHQKSVDKILKEPYSPVTGKWIVRGRRGETFNLDLSGLDFPADKNEIIESAKRGNNSKLTLDTLNLIPQRKYHNVEQFSQFVREAFDSISSKERKSTQQVKS